MVEIFQCIFYLVLVIVAFLVFVLYVKGISKPNKTDLELERQTDLLVYIDNKLIGIDCRLRNIEEKAGVDK